MRPISRQANIEIYTFYTEQTTNHETTNLDSCQLLQKFLDDLPIVEVLLDVLDHNALLGQLVVDPSESNR